MVSHPSDSLARHLRRDRALLGRLLASDDAPDEVARIAGEVTDWHALLDAAAEHGVAHAVFDALRRAGVPLPADISKRTEELLAIQGLESELSLRALQRCLDALDAARIPAVVLKGPLLAERLYGSPAARASTDIDLLVDARDLDRATEALGALKYRTGGAEDVRHYLHAHHHIQLFHDVFPIVELHFAAHVGFGITIAAAPLLARAIPYVSPSSGVRARVLCPADELVYLAVHGAGHRYARLMWLYDLKLFARAHPSLRAAELLEHARSLGVRRALGASLYELRRTLRAEIPDSADVRRVDPLTFFALPLFGPLAQTAGRSPSVDAMLNVTCASLLCDSPRLALGNVFKKFTKDLPRRFRRRTNV